MERLIGAHMSIAGGYEKAIFAAARFGMTACQVFTKNSNQWRAKPITQLEADRFRAAVAETGIGSPIAHDSYLINLASPDPLLWDKSIAALIVEIERAALLGIKHVVTHPGSHVGSGEENGLNRVVAGLDRVFDATNNLDVAVALENTAGQGSNLGYALEHLGTIIARSSFPTRLSVCLDTCHLFAAGHPLAPKRDYDETMARFDRAVGFDRLVAVHANDSKTSLGSRVDRHAHIGRGSLGLEPFRLLLRDRRLSHIPVILETPKGIDPESNESWDTINLRTLRDLESARSPSM